MATRPAPPPAEIDLWLDAPGDDETPAGTPRRALKIAGALLGVLFLLALVVPIGSAVIGTGQVGVESRVKRIAHPSGGVIAQIAVENGEHVSEGQLLMRLEDTVSGAQAEFSGMTLEQLFARRARLDAERVGAGSVRFSADLAAAKNDTARSAMADERQLFSLRRTEETQLRAQLEARLEQSEQEITGYNAQISALRQQRALVQPELEGLRSLWERKLVTINRLNELERTAVGIDGSIASLEANIAQARARMTETREQLIQLSQSRRAQAATELAQVNTALNDQRIRNVSASDLHENSEIRAPYSGTVEKIAFAAIGDVVQPAQAIMEIVPDKDLMVVEAAISPSDIDRIRTGQAARVRFALINRAATPEIRGKVIYVATDRTQDAETGAAFFLVRIEIDQAMVAKEALELRSGMPADVFIETGKRSLISFVTKPIADQIARAFRE